MKQRDSSLLRYLKVSGGFLDGLEIQFDRQLNCLLGHRGAGKSLSLESIRYALDAFGAGVDDNTEIRKSVQGLVGATLRGGTIELGIESRDGLPYRVICGVGEQAVVCSDGDQSAALPVRIGSFFPIDVFSQNQIERIADDPHSQLALIDGLAGEEMREVKQQLGDLSNLLATNAHEVQGLVQQLLEMHDELSEVGNVEERLKGLANTGKDEPAATEVDQAHLQKALRTREWDAVESLERALESLAEDVGRMSGRLEREVDRLADPEVLAGTNGDLLQTLLQQVRACAAEVDQSLQEHVGRLLQQRDAIAQAALDLNTTHAQQELAFRELLEKHQKTASQTAERTRLEQRRSELLIQRRTQQQLQEQYDQARQQREELLQLLLVARDRRFTLRKQVAQRVNKQVGPSVRVRVSQCGNRDAYRQGLERNLKDAAITHKAVARKLADTMTPTELAEAIWAGDADALTRAGLNSNQAQKVIAGLENKPILFDLETVDLQDAPHVELKDGDRYKESLTLSTGQKCTAILPILMLDGNRPLLIDQPEDNLDNSFIYDLIVKTIRSVKRKRQLIFATHNPNIPVLGDARVFVLDSDGQHGTLVRSGTVDKCRAEIVTLLEGGEQAFEQRRKCYGIE